MDFSCIQTILKVIVLLLLYALYRSRVGKSSKQNKVTAPEPSGALPLIGHLHLLALRSQDPLFKTLEAIADRCGPIYSLRLGINRVLVASTWEVVKDCLTTNDRIFATRASIAARKYVGYNNAIFALAPYGQYWRDVRKLATIQLLSNHGIERLKHVRLSETHTLIKDLHNLCANDEPHPTRVTISKLLENMTFNMSLRMTAGKRLSSNMHGEETSMPWRCKKAIEEALHLTGIFVLSDAIPWLEWMDFQGHISAMKRNAKEIDAVMGTWLEEHLEKRLKSQSTDDCDLMDAMLSSIAEGAEQSGHSRDIIIKATVMILIFTGSESTAVTLTWALSLLLNHPSVLKKAQEELDSCVGRGKWVQESDIQDLKYLKAIVKETLRLYPPAPLTGIREAMEDCYVSGYFVPKGTRLLINLWKLQRDSRVWESPNEFQPERFLTTHAGIDFKDQNFEYLPFSYGRRSCPGTNLGLQIVHLAFARILQGFDIETVAGLPVDMTVGAGIALPKVNPLEVVIKPRLASELYH